MFNYRSFNDAYHGIKHYIKTRYEYEYDGRNGKVYEVIGLSYRVDTVCTFPLIKHNTSITREYCRDFYSKLFINAPSDTDIKWFKETYKDNVKTFLDNPKGLSDGFNTIYGNRISRQLPIVKRELLNEKGSRRAVIKILSETDNVLLGTDEVIEYPCIDSISLFVRDGKLNVHTHMRSNNMGTVAVLDMYLIGRLQSQLANELNLKTGVFSCSIASAHIFEKDL
ncbi:thymidylate synthase and pyrimidine hydroxymethylase [Tenacibaculum phage PTm5]|nr:thymidylate synthase and pyrimidine hydroxymethylase [Tenacibaculum phage PTm5]